MQLLNVLALALAFACSAHAASEPAKKRSRFFKPKKNDQPAPPKPPPPKLNTDNLPSVAEILESVNLSHRLKHFYKQGITDTRFLLRMTPTDFNMMRFDIDDYDVKEFTELQELINKLIVEATVVEAPPRLDLIERGKLKNGRLYLPKFLQSFEYTVASFGSPPPIGNLEVYFPDNAHGCNYTENLGNMTGKVIVIERGVCSFLEKAVAAHSVGATMVAVINTEDRLESPSSGLGVIPEIKDHMVLPYKELSMIALSNTTLGPLKRAYKDIKLRNGPPLIAAAVPLKCGKGGACNAVAEEDKAFQTEVSWGTMRVKGADSGSRLIDFLTSTYGGAVPENVPLRAVRAVPQDACSELDLSQMHEFQSGYALIVDRGRCPFGQKSLNAQAAGAALVILIDKEDPALQRPGSVHPIAGYIEIPTILIPWDGANYLLTQLDKSREAAVSADGSVGPSDSERGVSFDLVCADDASLTTDWIDVALTEFSEASEDKRPQIEGLIEKYAGKHDIVAWLRRKMAV